MTVAVPVMALVMLVAMHLHQRLLSSLVAASKFHLTTTFYGKLVILLVLLTLTFLIADGSASAFQFLWRRGKNVTC